MTQVSRLRATDLPAPPAGRTGWPWVAHRPPVLPAGHASWPWISIITPSYNQAAFIEETIRSVLLQGYPALEYIIIDGGSDDGTVEIIQKYSPWLAYWVSEKDRGQSHAINKGLAQAQGEVIAWLNSDDVLREHSLATIGSHFVQNPTCEFLAGRSEMRDVTGNKVVWQIDHLPRTLAELLEYPLGRYLAQPSVFFKRRVLERVAPLDEHLHYAMDLDLWLRIAEHYQIHILPQTLSWIRAHDNAKTFRENLQVYTEVESIIARYRSRLPLSKYRRILRAIRRGKAHACLKDSGTGRHCKPMRARIFNAVEYDKTIVFTRKWLGLALRLALPLKLQRLVFTSPGDCSSQQTPRSASWSE
jgi:GT2 family glycosyltransferase